MRKTEKTKVGKLIKQGLTAKTAILLVQLEKEREMLIFNQKHYKEHVFRQKYDGTTK